MKGRTLLAAIALFAAVLSTATAAPFQIPWRDVRASDCSVLVEPALAGGSVLTLRCKGHIDLFLTRCSADRCAP